MQIKLKNGRIQRYPDAIGKVLVARGIGEEVKAMEAAGTYQTRMLTAAAPTVPAIPVAIPEAPYGYKADGTPRKRPGRSPAVTKANEEE